MNALRTLLAIGGATALTACAATLPESQVVDTQSTLQAAEEIGQEDPDSQLHVKYARDQIAVAKDLADEGEEDDALLMLDRAQSDAELALALARTNRARIEAQEAWNEVEEVRERF